MGVTLCPYFLQFVYARCLTIHQSRIVDMYEPGNECVWLSPEMLLENNPSGRLERT